jgi:hypothetical protein
VHPLEKSKKQMFEAPNSFQKQCECLLHLPHVKNMQHLHIRIFTKLILSNNMFK